MTRTATINRVTNETQIQLELNLDGTGQAKIQTGVGFLDHMLDLFTRHGALDLQVTCQGDRHIDDHHSVEDVGICLGQALKQAVGDKAGIRRYGHFTLPMDETLVTAALDLSGRPMLVYRANFPSEKIGTFDTELVREFWQAFASNSLMNLHVVLHHGENSHHISEAMFKAIARSLRAAVESDGRMTGIPSTKGKLSE
ncbi:MAG: imidazoleglycerol-phosphate dehydratase HisB [Planctomycetales bacterium]|nr:imidazoleglycerol-phosphate dehydratase HisB [Planctomycetales bacterium]